MKLQTAGFSVVTVDNMFSWCSLFYFLCKAVKLQRSAVYWWCSLLCPLPSATIAVFSCASALGGELCQCMVFMLEGIVIHHWMGLLPRCPSTALYIHLSFWPFFMTDSLRKSLQINRHLRKPCTCTFTQNEKPTQVSDGRKKYPPAVWDVPAVGI